VLILKNPCKNRAFFKREILFLALKQLTDESSNLSSMLDGANGVDVVVDEAPNDWLILGVK
jgi:hypothetical protein